MPIMTEATRRLSCAVLMLSLLGGADAAPVDDGVAHACADATEAALGETCRAALEARPEGEALAQVERWVASRRFGAAVSALEALQRVNPWSAIVRQRLHEVRSMADESAWLARREAAASGPAPARAGTDVELDLAETRCLRLTGEVALQACEVVLARRPEDTRIHVARGDALWALGRADAALGSYRAAAARDRSPALARKIAMAESVGGAAAAPLAQASGGAPVLDPALVGRYHALVIGINAYRHLDRLSTAINDARALAELLRGAYGFEVRLLTDSTRADIVEVLDDYRGRLEARDNLVIYYAGHGWLDAEADKGFWLPVDARPDRRTQWVSNDTVRDALRALKAKHVLVIADSCFSGTLTRGAVMRSGRSRDYFERMARLKARQVLTSGGLEPVADSAGAGHSPFAVALIAALRANAGVLDATSLFGELRRPVALNSEQLPQFADIRMTGHEGGDFLFVRRR
jgi:tetratricopeptide (TPR) repeat protein